MSVSPLSGAMAQPAAPEKKKKKRGGALLLISGIALAASLGGVFASNAITINSGQIEFGAGTATTTTCEASLTAVLTQTYSATLNSNAGGFQVASVVLTGDFNDCKGDTIGVTLIGTGGAAQCSIDGSTSRPDVSSFTSNATSVAEGSDGFKITASASGLTDGTDATVTIPVATGCASTNVLRIGITTS